MLKEFLAIDIIFGFPGGAKYCVDITGNLSVALVGDRGFRIVQENVAPDKAIWFAMKMREQGVDVVVFPEKTFRRAIANQLIP